MIKNRTKLELVKLMRKSKNFLHWDVIFNESGVSTSQFQVKRLLNKKATRALDLLSESDVKKLNDFINEKFGVIPL